jgi:hypothetical protein
MSALNPNPLQDNNSMLRNSAALKLPAVTNMDPAILTNRHANANLGHDPRKTATSRRDVYQTLEAAAIHTGAIASSSVLGATTKVAMGAANIMLSERLGKLVLPVVSKALRAVIPLPIA